jgi:ABC-type multidrug transport system ATPase subunit
MIQVSGLSKDYRTVSGGGFLLSDISFTLQPKAITAILGTNGSGKSTLLKIIGGEFDADSGSVNVDLDNSNRDESADPLRNVLYLDPLLSKTDTNLTARVANASFADPELEF